MKFLHVPVEPHEAVPEVSKGKVHITQNKHVPIEWFVTTASQSRIWLKLFVWWLEQSWDLFALSQHATACDNKLQVAVRNDMRLFLRTIK